MTVYVDDMRAPLGRHIMCHMIADTEAELHAMAERIGVARKRYQRDHYDVTLPERALTVAAGAQEVTLRQLACMAWLKRHGLEMGDPRSAELRYRGNRPLVRHGALASMPA